MDKEIKPVPMDTIPGTTYNSKLLENLYMNPEPADYINQMVKELAQKMNNALDEKIKEVFKKVTGEEFTVENTSRVTVIIPPHTSILNKREIYHIDNKPVFTLLPQQFPTWAPGESYRVSITRQYIDHV